ncbi:MAG: SDR family oxidoreductase [Myxococcota bacterium]|nr:SDR family oxidoreductase [Myxococcota bacterium]
MSGAEPPERNKGVGHIFITGITGFLAKEVAVRYLKRNPDLKLYGLIRAPDDDRMETRRLAVLEAMFGDDAPAWNDRVIAVRGNLNEEKLGLSEAARQQIVANCSHFIHCGASVRFDQDLESARQTNYGGSVRIVELARAVQEGGQLDRIDYVGTSYVAGDRTGIVSEDDLQEGHGWKNSYEQTKWESERHMREVWGDLPVTIYRPAIIVGDSKTGATSSFNVLYWPIRIFATGRFPMVIGREETPIDVVPVDWVSEAMLHISATDESLGRCYALAAGDRCVRVEQLCNLASKFFDRPLPRFVDPDYFWEHMAPEMEKQLATAAGQLMKNGMQYLPYFANNAIFDTSNTTAAMEGSGLELPALPDYFDTLFNWCLESDWGRKKVPPKPRPQSTATT